MSPPQVSYTESNILNVSATFQYDRYVSGAVLSFNEFIGNDTNKSPGIGRVPVRGQSGVVFYDSGVDTRTTAEVNRRFFSASGQPVIN
jgi:hypothetical protein